MRISARAVLPIVVLDASLAPLSFIPMYEADHVWLSLTKMCLGGFLFPAYLAVIGSVFVWRDTTRRIVGMLGLIILASMAGVFLDYANWGISTRLFWRPDTETVAIMEVLAVCALTVSLMPTLVVLLLRKTVFANRPAARS